MIVWLTKPKDPSYHSDMFVLLASFLACFSDTSSFRNPDLDETGAPTEPGLGSDTGREGQADNAPDSRPGDDTAVETDEPALLEVDVLVVGSGPAGLTAAWKAKQTGARVLVLERDELAGGSGIFASNFFAVGTPQQIQAGVTDSPEMAAGEWAEFTGGGRPDDPWVQRLLHESSDILSWLLHDLGGEFLGLEPDPNAGTVERLHSVSYGDKHPLHTLIAELEEDTWLQHEATGLVKQGQRIVGATVTDLRNGESAWIASKETILATGGFARDEKELLEDRKDIQGLLVLYEAHHITDGGGLPLLRDAGAAFQNAGNYGLYVHAIQDPREGMEREALWIPKLREGLIVDLDGQRVGDETLSRGFQLQHLLLAAPERRLLVLFPAESWGTQQFVVPGFNLSDPSEPNTLSAHELIQSGAVRVHSDLDQTATSWGIPIAALNATVETYNAAADDGYDAEFNKDPSHLLSFQQGPYYSAELRLGAAKAFGGAELDASGRVLDENGEIIEGLWAAGEAAGMLGTEAVSQGFSGSVTACYLTGQVAGQHAAAEALSDP